MEPFPGRPRPQRTDSSTETQPHIQPYPDIPSQAIPIYFGGQGAQNTGTFTVGRDFQILNCGVTRKTKEDRDREALEKADGSLRERRQETLDSLRFEQMDVRYMSIKKAHRETCQWFLSDPDYISWDGSPEHKSKRLLWIKGKPGAGKSTLMKLLLRETRRARPEDTTDEHKRESILWIKGKPGAGKSTLMKLLLRETRRARPKDTIISFFFNARGNDMEKSTLGLYQSLLVQLLETDPSLQNILDNHPGRKTWSIELLKKLFEDAVKRSPETLICFIDALDECQEQEIRDMILFLNDLMGERDKFYTCFASRHYPNISVKNGRSTILENKVEHDQDIAIYLKSALQLGSGGLADQIRSEVQRKASGVFIWVVLVVSILNRDCDKGHKHAFWRRLREIPSDLNTLFHQILTHDTENEDGLLLCIQWVLFAAQPLSPRQLYYGILTGLEPENLADCNTVTDYITDDDISKFLLDMSKGLAESTRSESPTVQFIHESVRDYLLDGRGLEAIWPGISTNLTGKSHEALKRACYEFMTCMPLRKMLVQPHLLLSKDGRLPFLVYANQWILYHANQAAKHNYEQTEFLNAFPLSFWVKIHNLLNATHRSKRYSPSVSLAYVLASHNSDALISTYNIGRSCFEVENEIYGTPLFAAMAERAFEASRAILKKEISRRVPNRDLLDLDLSNSPNDTCFGNFMLYLSDFPGEISPIHCLAMGGDSQVLRIFFATQHYDINALDGRGETPLSCAVAQGHYKVVEILAEQGANINIKNNWGRTPLSVTASEGSAEFAELLINKGAEVDARDRGGQTPCSFASARGHFDVVKLLIEGGADISARDVSEQTPCFHASEGGHIDVVKFLVKKGADVSARNDSGQTPCFHASKRGHIDVIQFLVEKGADVNARDDFGRTSCFYASARGHIGVVKFLIKQGADPNAKDKFGRTACLYASFMGHIGVIGLLLDHGADVDVVDTDGWSALKLAGAFGHTRVADLLVERGAAPLQDLQEGRHERRKLNHLSLDI
ncbi:hypothetical protein PG984_013425 [Apiospora sp. TS-2023a]